MAENPLRKAKYLIWLSFIKLVCEERNQRQNICDTMTIIGQQKTIIL